MLPLRWHLAALAVGALAPLFAFAVGLFLLMTAQDRTAIEQRLAKTADDLAADLDGELAAVVRTLQALAESERIDAGDLGGFRREADRARRSQTAWIRVLLASPGGIPLVNTGVAWGEPLPATTEARSLEIAARERRPVVGDLVRGGPDGSWSFAVRVPVMREGKLRAILTAVMASDAIAGIAARQERPQEEWTRAVVDRQGLVVARTRDPERFVGHVAPASFLRRMEDAPEGVYRDVSMEGADVFVAYSRSPLSGWTSVVAIPAEVVEGQSRRLLGLIAGIGFAVLLLSGGGAFALGRRLARSIESATGAAAALARGEEPRLAPSRVAEVNQLGAAFTRSSQLLGMRARERDEHLARAEAARAEAEAGSRAKDEFLAMLGHELRNPLAPITTALHLVEKRGQLPRELGIVRRQVQQLVRLVDDLLDVSRITRGKIELRRERLELAPAVQQAVETVAPLLERRRHRLAVEVPPGLWLDVDPVRLGQVISNLLTNAARYTPPGGSISIRGSAAEDRVVLAVSDDGVGIPPELLPRVFELFVQGPRAPDRQEGGLGLGLTLVRTLVRMHGGEVAAASAGAGRGSTFTITLPRAAPPPTSAGAAEPPRAAAPADRLRVLVVDDNRDAADLLGRALAEAGHEVRVAYEAGAALELAAPFAPDVAVLDLGLPGMDGYALAAALRQRLGPSSPALIAVSGYGQASDVARTAAAGFSAHHAKPPDLEVLLAALARAGGARRQGSTTAA